jgi:hypothetical protein
MKFNVEKDKHGRIRTSRHKRAAVQPASDSKLSTAAARPVHERRREPLLMKHWKYLWRHEFIELRRGRAVLGTGYVDESTHDASIVWIQLTNGQDRILIHRDDGIDIWRVNPRIYTQRSQP